METSFSWQRITLAFEFIVVSSLVNLRSLNPCSACHLQVHPRNRPGIGIVNSVYQMGVNLLGCTTRVTSYRLCWRLSTTASMYDFIFHRNVEDSQRCRLAPVLFASIEFVDHSTSKAWRISSKHRQCYDWQRNIS